MPAVSIKDVRCVVVILSIILCSSESEAQAIPEAIPGIPIRQEKMDVLARGFSITAGYGFPNVDQSWLPQYYSYTRGTIAQTGPLTVSVNYHINNQYSAGLLLTYGKVRATYFATVDSLTLRTFNAELSSRTVLADFIRYFPGHSKIIPYSKLAIGINLWKQEYTGTSESEVPAIYNKLPVMAYQGAIGIHYPVYKSTAVFAEAGYGKYIINAGLSVRF